MTRVNIGNTNKAIQLKALSGLGHVFYSNILIQSQKILFCGIQTGMVLLMGSLFLITNDAQASGREGENKRETRLAKRDSENSSEKSENSSEKIESLNQGQDKLEEEGVEDLESQKDDQAIAQQKGRNDQREAKVSSKRAQSVEEDLRLVADRLENIKKHRGENENLHPHGAGPALLVNSFSFPEMARNHISLPRVLQPKEEYSGKKN